MGQRDPSPPTRYVREVQELLDEPLVLVLPSEVLAPAVRQAFARGLEPREAAVRICHDHSRHLTRKLLEDDQEASDLVEFAIANRIDACAELASAIDQDLLDLIPDLPEFVRQPCFSAEFRDMVAHIGLWHGIPEHRWSAAEAQAGLTGGATA